MQRLFVPSIRNFGQVPIRENTLYIIDIDNTVLYFPQMMHTHTFEEWRAHILNAVAHPTDPVHFLNFLEDVQSRNSSVYFLTARDDDLHEATLRHLHDIGVKDPVVHYKGNVTKGEYISKHFIGFDSILFIDDLDANIDSVHPSISCFKFVN